MKSSEDMHNLRAQRVIASLNREQVDFLDRIGKDAQFSTGIKLSRTQILSAMVNVLKRLELSGKNIKTATQLEQQIAEAMMLRRTRGGKANEH